MTDPSFAPALPPFYVQPVPLDASRHRSWRLLGGDAAFAAATASLPLTVSEFAAASRSYPIVFAGAGAEVSPVGVLGVERANLFIEDGRWAEDAYIPAYVRRYPFVLIEAPDKRSFALGIDTASPRVARTGRAGAALFEEGQPAELTRQALEFCRLYNVDHQRTRDFCRALAAADILVDRRADATLADGRKLGLAGFKVVDPERFLATPDETVLAWRRSGWLALVYHHLASLEGFQALVARHGRRNAKGAGSSEQASSGEAPPQPQPVLQ